MSEHDLWSEFKKRLPKHAHFIRVENSASLGTPDINGCCNGNDMWIELKHLKKWPKRKRTIVRIRHYTDTQRDWIKTRGQCGGLVLLLVQIEQTYLLFDWMTALAVGHLNKQEMTNSAMLVTEEMQVIVDQLLGP